MESVPPINRDPGDLPLKTSMAYFFHPIFLGGFLHAIYGGRVSRRYEMKQLELLQRFEVVLTSYFMGGWTSYRL